VRDRAEAVDLRGSARPGPAPAQVCGADSELDAYCFFRNGRFNSSCFGLTLGPFAQRCNAFNGSSWTTGASCTSTRITAVGTSGSVNPSSRSCAIPAAATSKTLVPVTSTE
jgi:hypothetical protein